MTEQAKRWRSRWLYDWLRRMVHMQPQEQAPLLAAFAGFFCLLCGYYLLRPMRDALGIAGGYGQLQWLFTATFIAMLLLVPVFGALAKRWPPQRFIPLVYRFFILNILLFAGLLASGWQPVTVGRVFFVWLSVYNLFVVSMFWSAMADRFSNEQGRRLFGFIAAGGTAGALVGPALAASLSVRFGVVALALLAAVLLELVVRCYRGLAPETGTETGTETPPAAVASDRPGLGGGVFSGLALLVREPYLLAIALYFLLHTLASTFLYLEQSRLVAAAAGDTASRTQLFALIDLAVSSVTLLLQLLVTARVIRRFGIGVALAVLPAAGLLAFGLAALYPTLLMLAAAQAMRRACDYAIARPAREVLFTVISREAKYKVKSAIETVIYRGGDAGSAWLLSLIVAAGAGFSAIALFMVPVQLGWIGLSTWLARRQQDALALRLKQQELQGVWHG